MLVLQLHIEPLQVVDLAPHRFGEVAIREAAGHSTEPQQDKSREIPRAELRSEHGDDHGGDGKRHCSLPDPVERARQQRQQTGDRRQECRLAGPAADVQRGAREDEDRGGCGQGDPKGEGRSIGTHIGRLSLGDGKGSD